MPNLVAKLLSGKQRRHRSGSGKRDHKGEALTQAGVRLLALHDYDAISMAKFAREAGTSVGTLYARFPEKDAFLYHVIASVFRTLSGDAAFKLDPSRDLRESALVRVERLGRYVIESMTERKATGVIRASIKLATVMPMAIEPFEEYRKAVSDYAVALLSSKLSETKPEAIRIAAQVVMGTVTDAVLQKKPGPMLAGTPRMIGVLTNVLAGYLGISGKPWAKDETDGKDTKPIHDDLTEEPPMDGSQATFDPELRRFAKKRTDATTRAAPALPSQAKRQIATTKESKTQKAPPRLDTPTIKVVKPPKTPPQSPGPPHPKRKRRVV